MSCGMQSRPADGVRCLVVDLCLVKRPFHDLKDDRARENHGHNADQYAHDHQPVDGQGSQHGVGPVSLSAQDVRSSYPQI